MKVQLIEYQRDALTNLLKTKNTRMSFSEDPSTWPEEKRAEHLAYMRDTIKSSWEFVDYIFQFEGVTRAFTHQLVRTRTGSYAQQSQRIVDASNFPVVKPESLANNATGAAAWDYGVSMMMGAYRTMIAAGVPIQDARGILPTNIATAITAKFDLRTLHEMAKLRLCTRTQGEYQDAFREMRRLVIEVHPWAEDFLDVHCVSTGTCAFPRYGKKECPVYLPEMDQDAVKARAHKIFWATRHVAAPIAKEGKAS